MQASTMIRPEQPDEGTVFSRVFPVIAAVFLYIAIWGGLSSMCGLSTLGLLPLSFGLAAIPALGLIPAGRKTRRYAAVGVLLLSAVLALLRLPHFLAGSSRLLNRLFQASAARHAYIYEILPVNGSGTEGIAWTLLVLGLVSGAWLGLTSRSETVLPALAPAIVMLGGIAWLGVSPRQTWMILLSAACVLCLLRRELRLPRIILIPAVLFCAAVLVIVFIFPGRSQGLADWEEAARDRLAFRTVSYGAQGIAVELEESEKTGRSGRKPFYRQDETEADEGEGLDWPRVLQVTFWILLVLILLFGPAVWNDRLKRLRAANRAGLDDADARTDICASVRYGLRFLREAGLITENRPFSTYAEEIRRVSEEVGRSCAEVVPIWQEAAYSLHPMREDQRRAVRAFRIAARKLAEEKMTWKQKIRTRWITAL